MCVCVCVCVYNNSDDYISSKLLGTQLILQTPFGLKWVISVFHMHQNA